MNAKRKVKGGHALVVMTKEKVRAPGQQGRDRNHLSHCHSLAADLFGPCDGQRVAASIKTLTPKVTRKNVGKAIIVVLRRFR